MSKNDELKQVGELEIDNIAKNLGLPQFSTNKLIKMIRLEMLYVAYKDLTNIVFEKPEKPKEVKYPEEPIEPFKPTEPVLQTISGNSEEINKINLELVKSYQEDKKNYPEKLENYKKEMILYNKKISSYQLDVKNYDTQQEVYKKEFLKYEKDLIEYEKFEAQKELNEKIKKVYKKWQHKEWNENFESKMAYFMLVGPPGHGKTTVFRQAGKEVAEELELVYIENPTINQRVDINSFVMYVQNLAGEVSKTGTAGIPGKMKDDKGNEYTGMIPSYAMSSLTQAGVGMLLLDDLANASAFIQNIALPLTNENSFNELKLNNVYVGVTANMGALDGTNTSLMSSAIRNRMKTVFCKDLIEDFIIRVKKNSKYKDEIGDMFVTDFLKENKEDVAMLEEMFYSIPKKDQMGGYSNPRSLEAVIKELRRVVYDHGEFNDANKDIIELTAKSTIGVSIGTKYSNYIDAIYSDAVPVINKYFNEGIVDEKIQEVLSGQNPAEKSFISKFKTFLIKKSQNELAIACKISKNEQELKDKFKEIMDKSSALALKLPLNDLSDFVERFKFEAISLSPKLQERSSLSHTGIVLGSEFGKMAVVSFNEQCNKLYGGIDGETMNVYKKIAFFETEMNSGLKHREGSKPSRSKIAP